MRKVSFFILLIIFFLAPVHSVFGISVGVKPRELKINTFAGKETKSEMLIFNAGKEAALYQVLPDAYNKKIFIEPAVFRLEPEGNQVVKVAVKSWRPGKFNTDISVVARSLSAGGIPVASGAKVPIVIAVSGAMLWFVSAIILFFCFLGVHMVILKKRNNIK